MFKKNTFLCFLFLTALFACTKDVRKMTDHRKERLLKSTDWKITKFTYNDTDYTQDFVIDTLHFEKKSKLTIYSDSGSTFSGTWYLAKTDFERKNNDPGKLVISITGNDQMYALSDDWEFVSLSRKKVELTGTDRNDSKTLTLEAK